MSNQPWQLVKAAALKVMGLKLYWQVFIAMGLGVALALFAEDQARLVAPLGAIFLRLLKMVIVPLIFTSIVTGVAGIGDARGVGRLGTKTLLYYVFTSFLAILLGLTLTNIIQPGVGLSTNIDPEHRITSSDLETPGSPAEILIRMIPLNPVSAAASGDILGLIFFSLAFGLAMVYLPKEPHARLLGFFDAAFEAMMKLTGGVIRLLPIGVLGLIADAVTTLGIDVFQQVGKYMLTIAIGLSIHILVVLPLVFFLLTRLNPLDHYRAVASALLTAFSTSSSSATLPVTMTSLEKNGGVSNKVSSFVLPMGATINMDGTALYECAGALFIAQALGADLSLSQQVLVIITALLASVGAAGIPSAGLVMIFIVLEAVGLNTPQAGAIVGVMFGIDRPLDMFRTMVNVTSDSVGAAVIAHSEGETLRYRSLAPTASRTVTESD